MHGVLMGDPAHFSVKGGANPHTRDRWGRRKSVDKRLAIRQWHGMKRLLEELGLRVCVVPPDPEWPGLVYPANAGVRIGDDFVLSTLTPTRAGERPHYRKAVESLGLRCLEVQARFEGEADLFPAGERYLFTCGDVRRQRFVPHLGIPPWRRIYGFRSDPAALDEIQRLAPLDRPALRLRLIDERYYHGDTCLASFGEARSHLLAYLPALHPESRAALRAAFRDRLIELGDADASIYAANSFAFRQGDTHHLVMPAGITARLHAQIRDRGVELHTADVSEFHKKGGGSVKCMIGDVGELTCELPAWPLPTGSAPTPSA
jgi:N-dimethylarginine dimethylaminohydrolase